MKGIGLVCEGGGIRGIYTAGILDYFIEQGLYFGFVSGVSAGAIVGASYVSKQKKRALKTQLKYINDKRYMSLRNLLKTGNIFDSEFAYYKMSKELIPFDYETFKKTNIDFHVGLFNCNTGETDFFNKSSFDSFDKVITVILASSSLPFLSKEVEIDGNLYLDGGIDSPIPLDISLKNGNKKNVVILTQYKGYQKQPMKFKPFISKYYLKYPYVAEGLFKRHKLYNKIIERIEEMERNGEVYILRPSERMEVGRLERDTSKILELYNLGYEDAKLNYEKLSKWLNR